MIASMVKPQRTIAPADRYAPFFHWMGHQAIRFVCFAYLLSACPMIATAEDFTDAIRAYLNHSVDSGKMVGVVVGIVDERGSNVISYGKLGNGTDEEVNGDTLFEIGSDTKTFTALLLAD